MAPAPSAAEAVPRHRANSIVLKHADVVPDGMAGQESSYNHEFLDLTGEAQPVAAELLGRTHPAFRNTNVYKNPRLPVEFAKGTQYSDDFGDKTAAAIAAARKAGASDPFRSRRSKVALYEPGAAFGGSSAYKDEFPAHVDANATAGQAKPTYTSSVPLMGGAMAFKEPFPKTTSYVDDYAPKELAAARSPSAERASSRGAVIVRDESLAPGRTTYSETFPARAPRRFSSAGWERVPGVVKADGSNIGGMGS